MPRPSAGTHLPIEGKLHDANGTERRRQRMPRSSTSQAAELFQAPLAWSTHDSRTARLLNNISSMLCPPTELAGDFTPRSRKDTTVRPDEPQASRRDALYERDASARCRSARQPAARHIAAQNQSTVCDAWLPRRTCERWHATMWPDGRALPAARPPSRRSQEPKTESSDAPRPVVTERPHSLQTNNRRANRRHWTNAALTEHALSAAHRQAATH